MNRRNARGRSQVVTNKQAQNESEIQMEDEVASDALDIKRNQRRKKSHQMKPDDSGDFEIPSKT